MVKLSVLFVSVFTLFCYMIPGFILRKTKLADEGFAKALSIFTLYVAQVAMIFYGFITEFDLKVLKGIGLVFLLGFISHCLFYLLARRMFNKAPERARKVLRFGVIFSNAGYMGIPVISDVFGAEYTLYATIYVVWFNVFAYSLGRLIYTEDKKYISVKKIFINPAVIPITMALILFLSGGGGWIKEVMTETGFLSQLTNLIYNIIEVLKNMVAPASMMVIGARLADINFKGIFKDKYMYPFVFIRLFLFPALMWAIMRVLLGLGFIDHTIMSIVLILSSTPAAAITTMFAELYQGDSPYAGKLVALTTILSVGSMPIVSLLLKI